MSLFSFENEKSALTRSFFLAVLIGLPMSGIQAAFTPPVTVNSNAASDSAYDNLVVAEADGKGTMVAVWDSYGPNPVGPYGYDPATGTTGNEDLFVSRSTDNGKTWSTRAALKTNAATDDADDIEPAIATDGQGRWIVVWRSLDSLGGTIGYDADILMTVSSDDGRTWSALTPVNSDAATDSGNYDGDTHNAWDYRPSIAADGQGHWMVTWIRSDNRSGSWVNSIMFAVSNDNGANWPISGNLATFTDTGIGSFSSAFVTTNRLGRWIIYWSGHTTLGGDSDLYYRISDNNGLAWTATALLNTNGASDTGDDAGPQMATDGQGHWIAAWQSSDSLGGTIGTDLDILYTVSNNNGQTWSAPAALNTDAATDGAGVDSAPPRIAFDGNGNWIVSWVTNKLGGDSDLVYATCAIGSTNWSAAQPVNSWAATDTTAYNDYIHYLTSDRQGHWWVFWSSAYDVGGGNPGGDLDILSTMYQATVPVELSRFRVE